MIYWQNKERSKKDSADLPKPVLAFPISSSKRTIPNPSANTSRNQTPDASSSGSLRPSDPGDNSPTRLGTPEIVQTPLQSLAESSEGTEVLEDGFDDRDKVASLREEALLRRRTSSVDADHLQNMPGVLLFTGTSLWDGWIYRIERSYFLNSNKHAISNFILSEKHNHS